MPLIYAQIYASPIAGNTVQLQLNLDSEFVARDPHALKMEPELGSF